VGLILLGNQMRVNYYEARGGGKPKLFFEKGKAAVAENCPGQIFFVANSDCSKEAKHQLKANPYGLPASLQADYITLAAALKKLTRVKRDSSHAEWCKAGAVFPAVADFAEAAKVVTAEFDLGKDLENGGSLGEQFLTGPEDVDRMEEGDDDDEVPVTPGRSEDEDSDHSNQATEDLELQQLSHSPRKPSPRKRSVPAMSSSTASTEVDPVEAVAQAPMGDAADASGNAFLQSVSKAALGRQFMEQVSAAVQVRSSFFV
jgi:hypothetical protein